MRKVMQLPKVKGPCKAHMEKYFFNRKNGQCEKFIYGGCQGNPNRFDSKEACEQKCLRKKGADEDICKLPKETGKCKAYVQKFYFNTESGMCEPFIYGGCEGNQNNFVSITECHRRCLKSPAVRSGAEPECDSPPEVGPCKENIPRYYYDKNAKKCAKFTYGGCGGNGNNYENINECEAECWKNSEVEEEESVALGALPEYCELPPETGPCQANITKFYYDHEEKECKEFQYGGCRGNRNSFYSKELCERRCKEKDTDFEMILSSHFNVLNERINRLKEENDIYSRKLARLLLGLDVS